MPDSAIADFADGVTANASDRLAAARSPFGTGDDRWISPEYIRTYCAITPVYVSGRWYLPDSRETVMSAGSAFGAANTLRLSPGIIDRTVTISELGVVVTTADAGQNIQIGIYRSSATTAYPTTLVGNTGSITLTGTGNKTAALSGGNVTLVPGLYWFATNNTGTAVVCVRGATGQAFGGIAIGSTTLGNVIGNALGVAFLTTPGTFGTWTADITANTFTEQTASNRALVAFKAA
jgi:hypothetical protein